MTVNNYGAYYLSATAVAAVADEAAGKNTIRLALGDREIKTNTLNVDQGALQQNITIDGPAGVAANIVVQSSESFATFDLPPIKDGKATFSFAEIMKAIPPGKTGYLDITFGGVNRYLVVKRSSAGLSIEPAKALKELAPLYQEIAADLQAGQPLVITQHVIMWDWRFTGAGKGSKWADGNKPATNLYWGGGYGIYRMMKKSREWELVKEDGLTVAFRQVIKPTAFWQKLGVKRPFEVYVVLEGHLASEILEGYSAFAKDVFYPKAKKIDVGKGQEISAGGASRIMGLSGHLDVNGQIAIDQVREQAKAKNTPQSFKKGVYLTTCMSAPTYADSVAQENHFILLVNNEKIAPEGYVFMPLYSQIMQGGSAHNILDSVAKNYGLFHHKTIPHGIFVNTGSGLAPYLNQYDWDQDGDGVPNRIDPEPNKINENVKKTDKISIYLTGGRVLEIKAPY